MKNVQHTLKPWQGRTWFMVVLLGIAVTLNLVGLQYVWKISSPSNLEFNYTYTWHVQGYSGVYYGYSEDYSANGHYAVNFVTANKANAIGTVTWEFISWNSGAIQKQTGQTNNYNFSYSLSNGQYLTGTDQAYNTTGMNVWFQVPGGFMKSPITGTYIATNSGNDTCNILDTSGYFITGVSTIWAGHVMPVTGIELVASGSYIRGPSDPYGNYKAAFTDKYFFTPEGFLIGEEYSETDSELAGTTTIFTLDSYVYVTSASYDRTVDFWTLFASYWLPYVILLALVFPIYDWIRWRPRMVDLNGILVKIHHTIPNQLQFNIESNYTSLFQAFLLRGRASGGYIVTASNLTGAIFGLGIVGPDEEFGTFFCPANLLEKMMKYAGVKYAFTETCPNNLKKIEEYDVFRLDDYQQHDLDFDSGMVKPLSGMYLEPVMKMIAHEDYGKSNANLSNWVVDALKTDVAFVATVPLQYEWVRKIVAGIREAKLKPSIINNEVVLGVGFAMPSGDDAWLYGLYVHPAFRNTGVGRALVMARLTALKRMGIKTAITEIADWNGPARKIYARFEPHSVGKYYYIGTKMPKVKVRRH